MKVAAQDHQQRHRQQLEKQAMAKIADRITAQFPELPAEQIDQAIHGRYEAFAQAPVRDFVPTWSNGRYDATWPPASQTMRPSDPQRAVQQRGPRIQDLRASQRVSAGVENQTS
jgi:hypothetical protein